MSSHSSQQYGCKSEGDYKTDLEGGINVDVLPAGHDESTQAHTTAIDGDAALGFLRDASTAGVLLDVQAVKKVKRKIDRALMPILMFAQFLNFLDKSAIAYANLYGIQKDTGMHGTQFAWLGSIFYIGYLFWQPFSYFLQVRLPIKWHLGGTIILWGTVLGCHAACHNFVGLAICRFLLGVTESGMVPLLSAVTGMWYTREEQATRVGFWFGSVGMSQIIGGLIAYGMFKLNTEAIQQWQFIFCLMGPVTVLFGCIILWRIPSSPTGAIWLTKEEKIIAIERIRANKTGTVGTHMKTYQVWEAMRDPRFYLSALGVFTASIPNGGISSFGATIIKGFGYNTKQTTLLGMSTGASETVAMLTGIILAKKMGMRGIPAGICIFVAVIGAIMMIAIPSTQTNARFAGYVIVFWFPVGQMLSIGWFQSMVAGHTKRATFYVFYQIAYATGNIIGAQLYLAKDAPSYIPAKIGTLVCLVVCSLCYPAISYVNWTYNKRRDAWVRVHGEPEEEKDIEFMDKTDFEIQSFRYVL